ncbi:MAG: substrate-binding domain-containing protein [Nitrososphaeria archaeon]
MIINRKSFLAIVSIIILGLIMINLPKFYAQKTNLRIATTTSLDASGLLDKIKVEFEKRNPTISVTWIAVGTGQAIEIGKRGDADIILVHNRQFEDKFISEGYGVHGVTFAWNDFVLVGPKEDPAKVNSSNNVIEAFKRIYEAGEDGRALFISRGDMSGTHLKEMEIWNHSGLNVDKKRWYIEIGQGMEQALIIANERQGYTLSDRATYLSLKETAGFSLKILFERDSRLLNLYRAIIVNPNRQHNVNYECAQKFVQFLVSSEGQNIIGNYTKKGQILFYPAFGRLSEIGINDSYEEDQVNYWRRILEGD